MCLQAAVGLLCKVDELYIMKAESASGMLWVNDDPKSGFGK